jgi:anti-sigma B factor antagonist
MIKFEKQEGQFSSLLKCKFQERLDTNVCLENELEAKIDEQIKKNSSSEVEFDLQEVDYISSAFLRICIKTAKTLNNKFSITNVKPEVLKVFKISGLDKVLNIK